MNDEKSKDEAEKQKVDSYFRRFSRKHNITQDYIIEAVNKVRYKKGDKNGKV